MMIYMKMGAVKVGNWIRSCKLTANTRKKDLKVDKIKYLTSLGISGAYKFEDC